MGFQGFPGGSGQQEARVMYPRLCGTGSTGSPGSGSIEPVFISPPKDEWGSCEGTRQGVSLSVLMRYTAYLFKVATPPLLPVHHIMKNRNHDIPEIWLGYQGHFQKGPNQGRDEMKFVFS